MDYSYMMIKLPKVAVPVCLQVSDLHYSLSNSYPNHFLFINQSRSGIFLVPILHGCHFAYRKIVSQWVFFLLGCRQKRKIKFLYALMVISIKSDFFYLPYNDQYNSL